MKPGSRGHRDQPPLRPPVGDGLALPAVFCWGLWASPCQDLYSLAPISLSGNAGHRAVRLQPRAPSTWQGLTLRTCAFSTTLPPPGPLATPPPQVPPPPLYPPCPLFSLIPQITWESVPEGGQPVIHSLPALALTGLEDPHDGLLWVGQAEVLQRAAGG